MRKTYFTLQFALTAYRNDENAAVVDTLLRNYAPQSPFVADFWDYKFSLSDLPAVAETSRNARSRQEITVSDSQIIEQADCSMMTFRTRLKESCGLTDSNIRKVISEFTDSGKLERYKRSGSKETWIASPERMNGLKQDWKF